MDIIKVFIVIGVCFVIFLLCREVMCWYWKVNRIIELLEKIAANTSNNKYLENKKSEDTARSEIS